MRIRLDAGQVICQPALSQERLVTDSGMIPDKLCQPLDDASKAPMVVQVKEEAVRELIEESLDAKALADIVKAAATYDTALDGNDVSGAPISGDLEQLPHESLTGACWLLEVLPLQIRVYTGTEETNRNTVK